MLIYDHLTIEARWQKYWEDNHSHEVTEDPAISKDKRRYVLDMFPYPSGAGLHVGHPEGYTATDIYCRYLRLTGQHVLHPMGWDAFGLPAENYAIKQGVHPQESTWKNIDNFRRQIKSIGFSYDWTREINTAEPEYYKWTQWFFLLLYKQGLAYKRLAPVNWCSSCQTVLAREQVVDGRCERCGSEVIQKDLEQWFFKITDYADRLLADLDKIDWPEPIKLMQRNWIGKSAGAVIKFKINPPNRRIKFLEVFTTRPDTIFGATYMVISPEHSLVADILSNNDGAGIDEVRRYVIESAKKNERQRTDLTKDKTGVLLPGITVINPASGQEIPIWIADYVLMSYGTGAIMAVPAHDERDFEFAQKYHLAIIPVVEPKNSGGLMINSSQFNGLDSEAAQDKIVDWLRDQGLAEKSVQYKIRDWLVSRQRYWGAPIPIIYCEHCGEVPVPVDQLPVELPVDVDFRPTGESPLQRSASFHNVRCPKCQSPARRESDTLDTFVCSSWYLYRYADPRNQEQFAAPDKLKYWLPVDLYVGGAEHAVLHLLYARFFCKVLFDQGLVEFDEPFKKLLNQGLILAEDGRKMSKSLGNVINPDEIVETYGADTLRLYEMFIGPLEDSKPWSTDGIKGVRRFLERVFNLNQRLKIKDQKDKEKIKNSELEILLQQTIKKVTEDIISFKFNTAISQLMIFVNALPKQLEVSVDVYEKFLILLSPFAPHLAEELWSDLGQNDSIFKQGWPTYNADLLRSNTVMLLLEVNGKVRDQMTLSADLPESEVLNLARSQAKIQTWLANQPIKKEIYIPGKLVNFVI